MLEKNIRVIHLYDKNPDTKTRDKGGLTICYHYDKKNSFLHFSTSVCSLSDMYNRKLGRQRALENLREGKSVMFPYNKKVWNSPTQMLIMMMGDTLALNGST